MKYSIVLLLLRFLSFIFNVSFFQSQASQIFDAINNNAPPRSLFGSPLYDDDYESEVPRIWIPFCRRGHAQITGSYFNFTSGRTEMGVMILVEKVSTILIHMIHSYVMYGHLKYLKTKRLYNMISIGILSLENFEMIQS